MSGRDGISRREFLGHGALGVVTLGALWSGLPGLVRKALAAIPPPLCPTIGFFAPHVYDTLAQVTGQIVPTDADPGGIHTCLATFLEIVASGDPRIASLMNTGAAALDQSSQILFGSNFEALAFADQTEVLERVEANQAPGGLWSQLGPASQATWFGTTRLLAQSAWLANWPEVQVRDPVTRQPVFSDADHLISNPNLPGTGTAWDVVSFHGYPWDVERLMWEWQAGLRVIGFDGIPILDHAHPLGDAERLAARDALYALSEQGLA
jgi:hypothetical protein